jgi:outer membrane protein TolC
MSREQGIGNREWGVGKKEQKIMTSKQRVVRFLCPLLFGLLLCANLQAQEAEAQEAAQQAASQEAEQQPASQQAAAPMRLTPDEAVEMAIKNNLSLESSRTSLATRRRASELSWNQFIPNVTVAGSIMRDNYASTVSGFYPVDLSSMNSMLPPDTLYGVVPYSVDVSPWHVVATVQASINLNMAMFENMKRLRIDYEGGLLGFEKAKTQLERDVRKAYHNMLLLQENIALLHRSIENVDRQVQMAQANYNAGLAPELTLLQARVARENMRPILDQAENGMRLSMAQFAMYLGMGYNSRFELVPVANNTNFIPLDVSELIKQAAAGRPDIQELRHTIMMMESARKAQFYSLTPTLSLSWNHNSVLSWAGDDSAWTKTGSLTISLGIRLHSFIPQSTDNQGIKALDDQINTARIGLAQLINGTEIEIYNIILSLERTRTSAEAQSQTVQLAEQAFRLTEQAYQAGLQDYFQVQNAQQSLHQARVQMLEQQFNYINGLIDLEYSIGVPFGTLSGRRN